MSALPATALPSSRDENWRYANLRALSRANADAAPISSPTLELPPRIAEFDRWVFIDGHFDAASSARTPTGPGRLLDARAAGDAVTRALDEDLAAAGVDFALARANAERGPTVAQIALTEHSPPTAIELVFVASAPASRGTSYPRVQVHVARNANLRLIERHVGLAGAESVVNAAVDVALGAGSTLDHVRVQACPADAGCFDTLVANVGELANYHLRAVTVGAASSRSTAFIRLAGRGARCEYTAASIAGGTQTHDAFVEIEHVGAGSITRQTFRGIANDRGKLGFNGKMIVRETGIDADSDQSIRSLLTGAGAEAAARPQLEIYTDRGRAKHGATTGKLDEQMLFYLLSRGLDRGDAQALLQWAFVEDVISRIEPVELRHEVESLVAARLREVAALRGLLREAP